MPSALKVHATDSIGTLLGYGLDGSVIATTEGPPADDREGYMAGGLVVDRTNGTIYQNVGTKTASEFVEFSVGSATRDGGYTFPNIPWTDATEIARSAFGVSAGADGPDVSAALARVSRKRAQFYRGIGITGTNDGRISECTSTQNYIGAKLTSSDSRISDCDLFDNRDANLWIAASAGNCQSQFNHCYGGRVACYNEGGGPFRGSDDTYGDSLIGYLGDANGGGSGQTTLTDVLFQHNKVRDVVFRAYDCTLADCTINVQRHVTTNNEFSVSPITWTSADWLYTATSVHKKVGVQFDGQEGQLHGGTVVLDSFVDSGNVASGKVAEGIWFNADQAKATDFYLIDADGINGSIGMRVLGTRKDIKIDCTVRGFEHSTDRVLILDSPDNCTGLDITLRIPAVRTIANYVDMNTTWKGTIQLINTTTGAVAIYIDGVLQP